MLFSNAWEGIHIRCHCHTCDREKQEEVEKKITLHDRARCAHLLSIKKTSCHSAWWFGCAYECVACKDFDVCIIVKCVIYFVYLFRENDTENRNKNSTYSDHHHNHCYRQQQHSQMKWKKTKTWICNSSNSSSISINSNDSGSRYILNGSE